MRYRLQLHLRSQQQHPMVVKSLHPLSAEFRDQHSVSSKACKMSTVVVLISSRSFLPVPLLLVAVCFGSALPPQFPYKWYYSVFCVKQQMANFRENINYGHERCRTVEIAETATLWSTVTLQVETLRCLYTVSGV